MTHQIVILIWSYPKPGENQSENKEHPTDIKQNAS